MLYCIRSQRINTVHGIGKHLHKYLLGFIFPFCCETKLVNDSIIYIDSKFLDELFRALSVGLSRPSHLASLKHVGKAQFGVIPGKDEPNYFHVSIFTFHRSTFLMEIQKHKTGLPWHQRAQRLKLLYVCQCLGVQ